VLAGIVFTALMLLSAYLLPAANREFKDLQFEIRNRFVSSLLQEGAFTTIGENLTVYIGSRNERGEVVGILVNDERDPQRPITIFAERGAFVDSGSGSRIIMANGNRQQFDRKTDKLSHLSFDRYTLELDSMREVPSGRFQEAQERFLGELFFPAAGVEPSVRRSFSVEGHQRLTVPLSAFAFAILPLACLLPGQFNRRGQLKRVLLAIGIAFLLEATDVGVRNFAARYDGAIPLMYMTGLLPFVLGFGILLRGGIRAGFRRPAAAALAAR
jgi:lipopolysaccharide export system permease protein